MSSSTFFSVTKLVTKDKLKFQSFHVHLPLKKGKMVLCAVKVTDLLTLGQFHITDDRV